MWTFTNYLSQRCKKRVIPFGRLTTRIIILLFFQDLNRVIAPRENSPLRRHSAPFQGSRPASVSHRIVDDDDDSEDVSWRHVSATVNVTPSSRGQPTDSLVLLSLERWFGPHQKSERERETEAVCGGTDCLTWLSPIFQQGCGATRFIYV